jgi:hypothetical protein
MTRTETRTRIGSAGPRFRWLGWQAAALAVVATLTVALSQVTVRGTFTGSAEDTANSVTAAADFCTTPGPVEATPVVDTPVDQENPSTNYHTDTSLDVVSESGKNERSLLKFSLPARPVGCVLTAATLKLRVASGSSGGTIQVHRAATAWTSATVTWNTMPALTGTAVGLASTSSDGTVLQWPVTAHVASLYAGPNHGFVVKDSAENSGGGRAQHYDSAEAGTAAHRPQLLITWG